MSDLSFATGIQLPPQNVEAEEAILGGILLDPEAIARVCDRLLPEAFYHSNHATIYRGMLKLHFQGKPTDLLAVTSWLTDEDQLMSVGGRNKLATLIDRTVSAVNIDALAGLVVEKYQRRQLIKTLNDSLQIAWDSKVPIAEATEQCQRKVLELSVSNTSSGLVHISEGVKSLYQEKYDIQAGLRPTPAKTGFYDLDNRIGGLHRKALYILAGRPSMGKTACGMAIAWHVASQLLQNVFVYSLETSKEDLAARLAAKLTRTNLGQFVKNQLTQNEWQEFYDLTESAIVNNSKLFICDNFSISPFEIRNSIRQMIAKTGENTGLIMIDHLTLLARNDKSNNKDFRIKVGDTSRMLKELSGEFDCPVLALSQLNRATEGRTDKRPGMGDLSESGNIEQDANVVMMLYRDEYYNKETTDVGIAEIITTKGRDAEIGTDKLLFEGQFAEFKNLAKPQY
ncbi:replicative DNA helicase [Aphanizomenon phage vB_AphaS-CL131]|nr:replicative DNA helicase [Aphanizomenon phage vB_AphaS-CL131]